MKNKLSKIIFSKKAFLWDFDGSVCDSEEIHYEAYAKAFHYFGHNVNKKEYFETFTHTGGGIVQEIQNYNLSCPANEIKTLKDKHYFNMLANGRAKLFSEIPQIIACLRLSGIKSVIASNSLRSDIETVLAQEQANHLFDNITGLEPNLKKKPAPDIFLRALSQLGLTPQEALIIEDSERGLLAAQAAGCDAIWIQTPVNDYLATKVRYLAKITHQDLLALLCRASNDRMAPSI